MKLFLRHIDLYDVRIFAFIAAVLFYALFGSPTPNNPGVAEALIAGGLVLSVGFSGGYNALRPDFHLPFWAGMGRVFLLFGLSVPFLKAVLAGHDLSLILRDVAPFLFMFLPVFLVPLLQARVRFSKYILPIIIVLGLTFSVRALAEQWETLFSFFGGSVELTYFANAPTFLFSVLFLIGTAFFKLTRALTVRNLCVSFLLFGIAALAMLPIVMTAQRASLGYIGVYFLIMCVIGLWRYPKRAVMFIVIFAACLWPFWRDVADVFMVMTQKTSLVGFNMRFEELAAVWARISSGPLDVLFGTGWGGRFESPAVGEVRVNFTHSLLSSALLKTGLVGLAFTALYMFGFVQILWRHLFLRPVLVLALAGPLVIDVFLYASFKSLDFGLILLLIAGLDVSHQNHEQDAPKSLQ